ncbi:putative carbohydrate-binding module family 13 protein [Mycena kentingensis (nom. inval.)]|nr:putative carbohydrate-binding module family 13 protein [Mycena kentingensis (nom. inval.)]
MPHMRTYAGICCHICPGQTVEYQTIVTNSRSCIAASSNTDGATVVIEDCDSSKQQQWLSTAGVGNAGQLKIFGDKCLDVVDGSTANGAKLQIWTCADNNSNQLWITPGSSDAAEPGSFQLMWANKGKCVDLTGGDFAPGTQLQVWDCDAAKTNKNQLWTAALETVPSTVQFALNANPSLCIAASHVTDLAPVVVTNCIDGSAAQTFTLEGFGGNTDGLFKVFNSTMCLMPLSSTPSAGTQLVISTCPTSVVGAPEVKQWEIRQPFIRNKGFNLCVDLKDSKQTAGGPLQLWSCVDQSANQAWNPIHVTYTA